MIFPKKTDLVRKNVQMLDARIAETEAMGMLIHTRIRVAVALIDVSPTVLREICAAHFLAGRRKRASELLLQDLNCQLAEVSARAALVGARKKLVALEPPAPAAQAESEQGLTPKEVDEVLVTLPEVPEPTRKTVLELLRARLLEKFS